MQPMNAFMDAEVIINNNGTALLASSSVITFLEGSNVLNNSGVVH